MTDQDLTEGHVAQGQLAMGRATALAPIYRSMSAASLPSPPLPASFWGRLRHHPQPVRFAAGRALWWLALGPLAAVPHPLSGARPVRRKYVDVFIGWRDRLSERIAGLAESLWERRS